MRRLLSILLLTATALGHAAGLQSSGVQATPRQSPGTGAKAAPITAPDPQIERERNRRMTEIRTAENNGVSVRLKDIARFRGVRANHLMGVGVVFGLEGTGDTKRNPQAAKAIANFLRAVGQDVDPSAIDPRNGALVMVTADLAPFANNGAAMDVTVTSLGDAKSLRGGTLLRTELYAIGNTEKIYAIAQGAVSIGGYSASSAGNKDQVGFTTVGRVPSGAIVENSAPTTLVYDGQMFIELADPDFTTASRLQEAIAKKYPEFHPLAQDGGTISVDLPNGITPTKAMAKLEAITVSVDNAAIIVINEKTGSIAIGGNVRIAPVAIATGQISVRIEQDLAVSQPNPFSRGETVAVPSPRTSAVEDEADIAVVAPNATVADLARIFQELRLPATQIINILQILRQQGALKARLVIQ